MLLKLQKYDIDLVYKNEMYLGDPLSRAYPSTPQPSDEDDFEVNVTPLNG